VNGETRKERIFSSEQKGEGGGNSNCRWEGILIVADHPLISPPVFLSLCPRFPIPVFLFADQKDPDQKRITRMELHPVSSKRHEDTYALFYYDH
jgi:hypothetical protein